MEIENPRLSWISGWLKTRTVRLPFAAALVLTTLLLTLSVVVQVDIQPMESLMTLIPVRDVLVNATGGFLGGVAVLWLAVGSRGLKNLRVRFSRPSVRLELGRAPENIFDGIELGAPVQLIKQKLGPPTRRYRDWWGYRYSDALVALTFSEDGSLSSIAVALTDPNTTFAFPAWHFDCPPLGKLTLKELLDAGHLDLSFEESARHRELRVTGREGPPGAWNNISFGALDPNIPGSLLAVDFEWDRGIGVLISPPQNVRVNWAAVHSSHEFNGFPWDFAIKL